jgi:hypothetical protein
VIRRAWNVFAAPTLSDDAWMLRTLAIPIAVIYAVLGLMPFWQGPRPATPMDVVWMVTFLVVIRQRDSARAEAKEARRG